MERSAGIVSAYLFGSLAEARAHAESDVDIGVLLDRGTYPTSADRFEARVRLATDLEHELAPRHPDVVVLNDAPPTFGARIVSTGRRLICRDADRDHAFRRDVQLRAADLKTVPAQNARDQAARGPRGMTYLVERPCRASPLSRACPQAAAFGAR